MVGWIGPHVTHETGGVVIPGSEQRRSASIFFFFLSFAAALFGGKPAIAGQIVLHEDDRGQIAEQLASELPEATLLKTLRVKSDVSLTGDEFLYLTDLREGIQLTSQWLVRACERLFAKKKFDQIELELNKGEEGVALEVRLCSFLTLQRLRVDGIPFGRHLYHQCYTLQPGDRFDEQKHNHSLEKITELLHENGYFSASVRHKLIRYPVRRQVGVRVMVQRGRRFRIRKLVTYVRGDDHDEQIALLQEKIRARISRKLFHRRYSREVIKQRVAELREYLLRQGHMHVRLRVIEQVDYATGHVDLVWYVDLNQGFAPVFFGSRFFSRRQLVNHLTSFGRSVWLLPPSILADELVRLYHSRGFWQVKIDTQEEDGRHLFVIDEGARARVSEVVLRGTDSMNVDLLIKRCFVELRRHRFADRDIVYRALDFLATAYADAGFLDMKVVHHTYEQLEGERYRLIVTVDEGVLYRISSVAVEGCAVVDAAVFSKAVGRILSSSLLRSQYQRLIFLTRHAGYEGVAAKPDIMRNNDGTVSLVWRVTVPERTGRFGKTIIQGLCPVRFKSLMSRLAYKPGQQWDQRLVRQSFTQLKELGVFESVQLLPLAPNEDGERDMLLRVVEDDPFEVRLRGGAELQHVKHYHALAGVMPRFGFTFIAKNQMGIGDLLRLDGDLVRTHREIVGRCELPISFSLPTRLSLQGYGIMHEHPGYVGINRNIYTVFQCGALANMIIRSRWWEFSTSAGIESMETSTSDSSAAPTCNLAWQLAKAINFDTTLQGKRVPFIFAEPTFIVDYLDSKVDPHMGYFLLLSAKGMLSLDPELSRMNFLRFTADQSLYLPIRASVLALRFRLGYIVNKHFDAIMPPERFYLGGSRSLRGYETDMGPPLGLFVGEDGKKYLVPRGGRALFSLNCELRVPLMQGIGGVLFQDIGALTTNGLGYCFAGRFLSCSGFGLRYHTPVGPLRFDVGWRWHKHSCLERSWAWFLTFGHAF